MTDEEKAEFIKETTEDICDWLASEKPKIKRAIKVGLEKGIAEGRKDLEKENADLQQRLDWAQGFLDKDVEYDELSKLRKENAELKMKLLTLENKEQVVTTTISN